MQKLIKKITLYIILFVIVLECLTRLFYLGEDKPYRYLDKDNVEKWVPGQEGYAMTGNRKQNFIKFHINKSGFNSYHEFVPTKDKIEVALIGDSFIEGFHQPYKSSTGMKIETFFDHKLEVFEYGYSGYDMADQLHLINAYQKDFELIDFVYIKLKFNNDLRRPKYEVMNSRLNMNSPINNLLKKSKLLIYLTDIGFIDPIKDFIKDIKEIGKPRLPEVKESAVQEKLNAETYIDNFKSLVDLYGYDKEKNVLLIDAEETSEAFINYLNKNNFKYIDFGKEINHSKRPATLIYDMHWNNYGRQIIANLISYDLQKKMK
tara:strand:+ start:6442 stop:7395 length:954 start_codon:yes stop_codon:yes gene_type:complete